MAIKPELAADEFCIINICKYVLFNLIIYAYVYTESQYNTRDH